MENVFGMADKLKAIRLQAIQGKNKETAINHEVMDKKRGP